ncbi:MAG: heme exporter protein D [Pseudoalteromonas tetraodonis]|jgi:heme exporter protein D|uniref:Heme exporter protein D n=5 Tax=Pseudoalteromonas TaxID=53246 RepID=A0A9W4VN67_PSEHA|nr:MULTISPECIES: heme exporter protein CcmD [Pseudoalteromonas]ADT69138.1 heme exporter protein D (cytochrome c-type biogenesis protein ccmD) [Pseudoalteromonas sp. SM9913]ALQ55443.1 Heme exporter protein D (Cytochrome c-type biogenesis protein ccmD) [Pseudoalteromonas issachenkonii]ATC91296.1 heme exporter protein D [Pseudoalteromonas issachenkonii]ATD03851.1 heme exporter protein D [Pseudoalteromonas tetraodonis]EWS98100.1 heme exporter protein D [Pseudoalteromonas sp. SCSIO_11900]|tara:strand:- start:189 stop:392 length:204 start_codon:yes stop_codon:yes gene_type:complete
MQFDSFSDFIAMGGYGFYVWLSFGTCALILLGILFSSLRDKKQILASVEQQIARETRIKNSKQEQTS